MYSSSHDTPLDHFHKLFSTKYLTKKGATLRYEIRKIAVTYKTKCKGAPLQVI